MIQDQFETIFNDTSAAATVDSQVINTQNNILQGSIQLVTNSAFNGTTSTIALKGSNDNSNWSTVYQDDNVTPATFTMSSGANDYTFSLKRILYRFYKVVYTKGDAAAGTLTANFIGK